MAGLNDTYAQALSDDQATPTGVNNNNSPIGFYSPEWYSPDANHSPSGFTDANSTPVKTEESTSHAAINLFGKVLDSEYMNFFLKESAKARFGYSTKPQTTQGGAVPVFTNNPNPSPIDHLFQMFAKPVQQNPDVEGPFSKMNMALIGGLVLIALFLFARR